MKEIDKILKGLSDGLKAVAKSAEAAAKQVEMLSKAKGKKTGAKTTPTAIRRKTVRKAAPKRTAPKKTKRVTAVDTVYDIISRSRKGVSVADLKSKTGFDDKKVANIVYKLKQQGKIKSSAKGVYSNV